jgi:hypothetical protein
MAMFVQLKDEDLPLYKLNFGLTTLIPKKEDASRMEQYMPICLLNAKFKKFMKAGTNRAMVIAHKVIRSTQTTFIPSRNILEEVVILHESVYELQRKKMDGVLFEIGKAYDKVKWDFLQQDLRTKGFSSDWCNWIARFVQGGSVGIRVNNDIGHYFQTLKGLIQGDPLSPILFNIIAEMLAILIARAKGGWTSWWVGTSFS